MRIIGIDPGTARAGWAILEQKNPAPKLIEYGCVYTKQGHEPADRLQALYTSLTGLLNEHKPQELAVEDLFFTTNAKTVIAVAQARGVVLLVGAQHGIPVFSYSPLAVKHAIAGYGKAQKTQVQRMVQQLLHLDTIPKPDDAADAIAVGVTHCYTNRFDQTRV